MNRHDVRKRRAAASDAGSQRHGQTAATIALATGCLAVVSLWKSTAANAAASDATRR